IVVSSATGKRNSSVIHTPESMDQPVRHRPCGCDLAGKYDCNPHAVLHLRIPCYVFHFDYHLVGAARRYRTGGREHFLNYFRGGLEEGRGFHPANVGAVLWGEFRECHCDRIAIDLYWTVGGHFVSESRVLQSSLHTRAVAADWTA
ncbi:MAG: hypothetical protein V3W37_10410, partial [Candidatus Binatia bacterium]